MKLGQAISWIPLSRYPIRIVQLLDLERLLYRQKMAGRKLLRDHLCLFEMRQEDLAIFQARHTRVRVRKMPIKVTKHGHVIQHVAEGVSFTSQGALNQFLREL